MMLCLLFLLLLTCVGVAEGRKNHDVSCSSSCGHLQKISYPFRLQSDPPRCGSPDYEILCVDGGKPMLELGSSAKYYVTDISYENMTIGLVDPIIADDKYCSLPLQSPPPFTISSIPDSPGALYYYFLGRGALFVNCTKPIQDGRYRRVPCLSGNISFVYVTTDLWEFPAGYMDPTCAYLASIPMHVDDFGGVVNLTAADIFELLKKGFKLSWDVYPTSAKIHKCLQEAKG